MLVVYVPHVAEFKFAMLFANLISVAHETELLSVTELESVYASSLLMTKFPVSVAIANSVK